MPSRLAAYDPQLEIFEGDTAQIARRRSEPLGEMQEMDLAAEILELRDERGLQAFLARAIGGVARAMGQRSGSPSAEALQRLLRSLLRQSMPGPNATMGSGAPAASPTLGDRLAAISGHSLGLELEGLSREDRRFETARQLVRFTADAAQRTLAAAHVDPVRAARAAVFAAGRRHAPGLLAGAMPAMTARPGSGFEERSGPAPPRQASGRRTRRRPDTIGVGD
jgi:hypothetical protein